MTKEEKTMYDSSLKYKWDNKNVLDYAKEEAKQEGRQEGIREGIQEGIQEGEYKKALGIAREMKKDGLPITQISKFTGLSVKEIEEL
jgi:predicted transposase/invertase (TIGR01784 family)